MNLRFGRSFGLAAMIGIAVATAGCTRLRDRQGYLFDEALVASVQPGVDTRESVQSTLGRPTFVGQFDQRDWYYVGRDTRALAFANPKAVNHTTLHIRFDEAGNVVSVDRAGLDRLVSVDPMEDKTPTLGRDRSFFEELFGNIGQVGAVGQQGGTADNPQ